MDIQSFIQSGLLEAYVLGQCNAEERALVEDMLSRYPEARAELQSIERALEGYASANAVPPPAWMKGRIMDLIDTEAPTAPTAATPALKSRSWRWLQLLALALAALAGYWIYRSIQLQAEKSTLEDRIEELQVQIDACRERDQRMEKMEQIVVLLRDRDTRPVALDNGKGTAYAYFNPVRQTVALDIAGLPAPAPGKYFQFWAIVDNQPVSMGMVDLQAVAGWQNLPYLENAAALAISQEDNPGGNATPTEVVMVGNIPTG